MTEPFEEPSGLDPIGGLVLVSAHQFAVIRVEAVPLELLQELVGGYVERVPLPTDVPIEMICNEEGMIKKLPYNAVGSHFYQWTYGFPQGIKLDIHGPAVFLSNDSEGDWTLLTEESVHYLGTFLEKEIFEKYGDD